MSEEAIDPLKPRRRPRYAGKHPRHFHEKYKEHAPDRYPGEVAHILASGKTPAGSHRPIMVREILEVLALQPGDRVVDCTLGHGGHSREMLAAIQPGGCLLALDQDPIELPKSEARLRALGFPAESLRVQRCNFAGLPSLIPTFGPADALLVFLGLSSMQIDDPARGFTYKVDAPLDMRMNPVRGLPAAEWIARNPAATIAIWLRDHADEPHAETLATAIARARPQTTLALATLVRELLPGLDRRADGSAVEACVRRVFQAIRIAVNDEFGALDTLLRHLPSCLKPGGRAAILSFHSGEDCRVKLTFKTGLRDGTYRAVSETVLRPGPEERRANPRSTPAKLRWAIRA